jgi:hypothetical protein
MSADAKVDKGAEKLERLVEKGRQAGGVKAKVADMFADDPEFLRKLKPSLIAARAKGEAPTDEEPTLSEASQPAPAPAPKPKAKKKPGGGGGPSPFVVIAAFLTLGIVLAHVVDWLGHRYPRD